MKNLTNFLNESLVNETFGNDPMEQMQKIHAGYNNRQAALRNLYATLVNILNFQCGEAGNTYDESVAIFDLALEEAGIGAGATKRVIDTLKANLKAAYPDADIDGCKTVEDVLTHPSIFDEDKDWEEMGAVTIKAFCDAVESVVGMTGMAKFNGWMEEQKEMLSDADAEFVIELD